MLPDVGAASPSRQRRAVDFPAPLGPSSPVIFPSATVALRLFTEVTLPYRFTKPTNSIAANCYLF